MIPDILKDQDDQELFIHHLNILITHWVETYKTKDIYITKIDNWFDQKWMCFSGTIMHEISVWSISDVKIPPFHPNRVKSTNFYRKDDTTYLKSELPSPLHIYQAGSDNHRRRIINFSNDGLFIWYSGNSEFNKVGSIMVYIVREGECNVFFVTLKENKTWNVSQTSGILMNDVKQILNENKVYDA